MLTERAMVLGEPHRHLTNRARHAHTRPLGRGRRCRPLAATHAAGACQLAGKEIAFGPRVCGAAEIAETLGLASAVVGFVRQRRNAAQWRCKLARRLERDRARPVARTCRSRYPSID